MKVKGLQLDRSLGFNSKFSILSPLQKKFFRLLQWSFRKQPKVFPGQQHLADILKCSREWVNKMLRKFFSFGWITWISRGRKRSNEYQMPPELVSLDLSKNQSLTKESFTPPFTHIPMNTSRTTSIRETGSLNEKFVKKRAYEKRIIHIPERIDRFKIPYEIKLKLSMVPEGILNLALETARHQSKKGWQISHENNYVAGTAIRMAQKQNIKLDWPAYYSSMKNYAQGGIY